MPTHGKIQECKEEGCDIVVAAIPGDVYTEYCAEHGLLARRSAMKELIKQHQHPQASARAKAKQGDRQRQKKSE